MASRFEPLAKIDDASLARYLTEHDPRTFTLLVTVLSDKNVLTPEGEYSLAATGRVSFMAWWMISLGLWNMALCHYAVVKGARRSPAAILAELDQCYSCQSSYHHCNMIASSIKFGISMPDRGDDSNDEADMALLLAV